MGIVVRESQRVSQTIEQFLSLSAPGRETFSVFSLEEVMAETLTMIRMSGELDDRIEVRGNYTQTAFEFFGNPGQFKQVFWNLFRNALRAMPEGGVLTLDLAQRKRGELAIRVADTGLGMTAEESSHMFEPFYTRFEGGRGLGLAVVRQIIDGYGGRIEVRSEPGVGTEILFTLPYRSPRRAEAEGARAGA
jgi:two-component system sensor histidine kinase PilS (NtrC family)